MPPWLCDMACSMERRARLGPVFVWLVVMAGCGFPRPSPVGGADDGGDGVCAPNQSLRCDGGNLVRCNSDGTAEVAETCSLGCSASPLHCNDIDPSNGLARYLDMAAGEPELDLGMTATINTSDGTVLVDGKAVTVRSALVAQTNAPTILVFIVHSLTSGNVAITGNNAFAVVSNGDITIGGIFGASASENKPGPGGFNDATCKGGSWATGVATATGGAGGGGFGTAGGRGGSATTVNGTSAGGAGGNATGTPTLIPLRGGCDGGRYTGAFFGAGGGAIQLVSHTKIVLSGVVAANGSSYAGGGSGGGLLLEAPVVDVSGSVVANGGAGAGGCLVPQVGENGHLDAAPAIGGGTGCGGDGANGGDGGAGAVPAHDGMSVSSFDSTVIMVYGGGGGGGVGQGLRPDPMAEDQINRTAAARPAAARRRTAAGGRRVVACDD
jgi:hypothetical protein